jgi:glycosyltransferase involved in cell wall biosynthesis
MLCGTPVIAFNRGAMPELICHEKTGFLVKTIDEAVEAVANVKYLKRKDCYEWSHDRFSSEKMANDYLGLYKKVLAQ